MVHEASWINECILWSCPSVSNTSVCFFLRFHATFLRRVFFLSPFFSFLYGCYPISILGALGLSPRKCVILEQFREWLIRFCCRNPINGGGERKAMIWCIHCPRQCAGQYCQILFSFSFFISPLKWTLIFYLFSICVDASSLTVAVLELGYNSSIWK